MWCNSFSAHINNISSHVGMVCFVVLSLKSAKIYMKAFWHSTKIMASESQVGQKEMRCILEFEKYFHMSQCYSGERCGPWASCSQSDPKFFKEGGATPQKLQKFRNFGSDIDILSFTSIRWYNWGQKKRGGGRPSAHLNPPLYVAPPYSRRGCKWF